MKKTNFYCPIFHQENIWEELNSSSLRLDQVGLFRPLEMILNPGELLLTSVVSKNVLKVSCPRLYGNKVFFALRRLIGSTLLEKEHLPMQSSENILSKMISKVGTPYIWGGNQLISAEEQNHLDSLFFDHSPEFINHLKYLFSGLDCSGLLYFASNGMTPRNTSELVDFGRGLDIDNFTNREILQLVRPLDLLVWKGHVLIFLNQKEFIESRLNHGVVRVDASSRIDEIREARQPSIKASESTFVIRRWIDS